MIVPDARAVIALLRDEPAASEVQRLIEGDNDATLTVLGAAEVLDYLVRLVGVDEDEAALDLAQLGLAHAPALAAAVAVRAGLLRARHYHRRDRALSLADSVAAETARSLDAPLATSDPHLLNTCAAEGIATVALPDARGVVWMG